MEIKLELNLVLKGGCYSNEPAHIELRESCGVWGIELEKLVIAHSLIDCSEMSDL